MVKLKRLCIEISPIVAYIVALFEYYMVGYCWTLYKPTFILLDFLVIMVTIPYFCSIMFTGKIFISNFKQIGSHSVRENLDLSVQLITSPYFNFVNFFKYLIKAHRIYMSAIKEEIPAERDNKIDDFWTHLEKPFKKSKHFL